MNEVRRRKIESAVRRELAELIMRRRVRDDRLGLVSVTEVKLAPDLSTLTAFVSMFASEKENKETWAALQFASREFQGTIARNLRLRETPRLQFEVDDRIKEGDRILDLMEQDKLRAGEGIPRTKPAPPADSPADETALSGDEAASDASAASTDGEPPVA